MNIKAIRGTKDVLPQEAKIWRAIEEKARSLFALYGYGEIRTPILEEASLFTRSIGQSSDIVRKEMYAFADRKKRMLCLRPEATASVVRAFLEHGLDKDNQLVKLYYFGPMFRAERPQAGRLRQFHHIGVEAIGSSSPYLDAEVISLAVEILGKTTLKGFTVHLNSIGSQQDRSNYKLLLKKELKDKLKRLCADCRQRYKLNLMRIFDCKNSACKAIIHELPTINESLGEESKDHFKKVQEIIDSLDIPYTLNPYLVRGLDYYTHTCFEIVHPNLGAQNALGAGGRYDDLTHDLGGGKIPAIGFALGLERIIAALEPQKTMPDPGCVFIAVLGSEAMELGFKLLHSLRRQGISSEIDYQGKSLKAQMRLADRLGSRYVVILGEDEIKKQKAVLRDMREKTQNEVSLSNLVKELGR
ncbi:MAG: histidine--tRNA ligase [Candidatus Omnitrophica bacterium]|nr:histidine--tRNA ligase [Candidatus Omnitrophota bacterium]